MTLLIVLLALCYVCVITLSLAWFWLAKAKRNLAKAVTDVSRGVEHLAGIVAGDMNRMDAAITALRREFTDVAIPARTGQAMSPWSSYTPRPGGRRRFDTPAEPAKDSGPSLGLFQIAPAEWANGAAKVEGDQA